MKIQLVAVGKTSSGYIREGIDMYLNRLKHYLPVDVKIISDIKGNKSMTEERQKELEGEAILSTLMPGDYVVLLDERGDELTSRQFSTYMDKRMSTVARRMVFIVGGPYGFSQKVYDRADSKLSLSRMTFNHEMVRLFFVEQLYRAMTILRGEPYHHD
ncbi:MAG: 23S rRNA (pseudouridine(1915)-N(3))-methyltransferase RlmH [Muribaculaceae bacterium]|nr:23S rRNA (pseudouridine(1915)-N(3))-methyltransferase RlmH [Muribaculaceae bacterium]